MLSFAIVTKLSIGSILLPHLTTASQIPLALHSSSSLSSPPLLGFGTWNLKISAENTTAAVSAAIQTGYRHIDCAAIYGNEKEVGKGIKEGLEKAGIERKDIWVTSKLWNDHHDPALVPKALEKTLADLDLEYLDLYLMHWPVASSNGKNTIDYKDTWSALSALPTTLTTHIGISNFSPHQLTTLLSSSSTRPFAHQFELHPYLQQPHWLDFHLLHSIHVTAYSPLGNLNPTYSHPGSDPTILDDEVISKVAGERGCTNAQVVLSWGIRRGTSVVPKSSHVERIEENLGATECALEEEDVHKIDGIRERFVKRFNDPSGGWGVELYKGLEGK